MTVLQYKDVRLIIVVVVVILFPTEYKQWTIEYISNIIRTRNP